MASLITTLSSCVGRMTPGERRFAQRLESHLEDDYLVWYDTPIGTRRAHPDFVILHPSRGILIIEVKDWKLDTIFKISKHDVQLKTNRGLATELNPLEQARGYAHKVVELLRQDPQLLQAEDGPHAGNLLMPWSYGLVLAGMTRRQFDETDLPAVLTPTQVICGCEMTESVDPEKFQKRLWDMFMVTFPCKLTMPQVDRVRFHLYPEIRINPPYTQGDMLGPAGSEDDDKETLPSIIRVMDMQQELLARSLGEGHRVIHGVAGSGKTMILGYRAQFLAKVTTKPILVLCFNVALSARLDQYMRAHGLDEKVVVRHFHGWCSDQAKLYQVDVPKGDSDYHDRLTDAIIAAVERGRVPRAQYGAILIDEGHDFKPEWLKLITQMLDPSSNALLMLYDDAQGIYKTGAERKFSLKSVGIQAQGRTTILRINYRNTDEVLNVAYQFAKDVLTPEEADDDGIPILLPESAGRSGSPPALVLVNDLAAEVAQIAKTVQRRRAMGTAWSDMAVLCRSKYMGQRIAAALASAGVPHHWLNRDARSRFFDPTQDTVKVMTYHSSKGLEFDTVIVAGIGGLPIKTEESADEARLLYVAMTRAMNHLMMTASKESEFYCKLQNIIEESA